MKSVHFKKHLSSRIFAINFQSIQKIFEDTDQNEKQKVLLKNIFSQFYSHELPPEVHEILDKTKYHVVVYQFS